VSEQPEEDAAQDAEAVSEDADAASEEARTPAAPEPGAEEQETAADDEEEAPEGPVFEASDRRARIVADHRGVRLALDDQECEFRWDEIGAVETESPRFGKRFTITVHTPDRRWYPIEIEATARSRFEEWESELDAVLDAYFEEGAEDEEGAQDVEDAEPADEDSESTLAKNDVNSKSDKNDKSAD
jgi:hypothetical protein